jgi:Secretion system C-terminal sorting domain
MKFRQFTYLFVAVYLLVASVSVAQVVDGKSRLDIGQKAKKTATSVLIPPLNSFAISTRIPEGIKLNKSQAVNNFYRQLLLNNPKSSKKTTVNEAKSIISESNDDVLFRSERISVSNIYPNPANDFAKIDFKVKTSATKANLSFYNVLGDKMASYELDSFDETLTVNTRQWDSGIYLYQLIVDGKKMATKKLIVRHN